MTNLDFKPIKTGNNFIDIIILIILIYLVYKVFKFIGILPSQTTTSEEAQTNILTGWDKEINELSKTQTQSFSNVTYETLANSIYESMAYAIGDDYGNVRDLLISMKNSLDVAKLSKAYGSRTLYVFGVPSGNFDLFTAVSKELGNEFGGLYSGKVNEINQNWQSKGIKYQI